MHKAPDNLFHFEFANLGKGKAEVSLRGIIGVPKMYADYVSSGAAGTLSDFEKELKNLGSDVGEVTLRIFSRGGDIFTAMAIHDVIAAHPAKWIAQVDGLAGSASTWLMAACDEIHMPANAWYFIHNVQTVGVGDYRALNKAGAEAEKFTADLARVYQGRMKSAGKKNTLAAVRTMMDEETWLNGDEAKELGLVDKVIGKVSLSACLGHMPGMTLPDNAPVNLEKVPAELRPLFDTPPPPKAAAPTNNPPSPTNDMFKHPTPIRQAASEGGESGGAATPPAAAPATPPPAAAPATAAPPAVENNAPPQADITAMVTNAVTAAIKPLNDRIAELENKQKHGITAGNLAGSPPAAVGTEPPAANTMKRADWQNLGPAAKAEFFTRPGARLTD